MDTLDIDAPEEIVKEQDTLSLYRSLYQIRRFEEMVLDQFSRGSFSGTTHTYLGQEANAVGTIYHLVPGDIVVSNHRCHGHFLAYGGDMRALFAELMGKTSGVCGGVGGSQHLHWKDFYSNGILAGMLPVATGMALSEKVQGRKSVTVAFFGDGALGEGVLYESLNLASLWGAPILYVLENNHIAQTTSIELNLAGDMLARFRAFNIKGREIDSSDILEILPIADIQIKEVRRTQTPHALILHTHRFGPHSKGDDTRSPEQLNQIKQNRDPLTIHGARLSPNQRSTIEYEVNQEVSRAFQDALDE